MANTYTSPYATQLQTILTQTTSPRSYESPYATKIQSLLGQATEPREFTSRYDAQINDLMGQAVNRGRYQSQYGDRIRTLADQLQNSEFRYDRDSDPKYQALRKQYARDAARTAEDVLGRASAATGGRASSYAVNAASQAALRHSPSPLRSICVA